ncbi:hypothetical protein SKAU_G00092200 [Synaphobranchus kaupii]|uniref:Uncharacterized protein n=1 Tax=Synaphobranchus kaupii TaxID=118154 RepID=A0A9Q1FX25_SYNKA|nr:hypothetical protein SKAU_G00092200 [Synaphobranchus kaupii]
MALENASSPGVSKAGYNREEPRVLECKVFGVKPRLHREASTSKQMSCGRLKHREIGYSGLISSDLWLGILIPLRDVWGQWSFKSCGEISEEQVERAKLKLDSRQGQICMAMPWMMSELEKSWSAEKRFLREKRSFGKL